VRRGLATTAEDRMRAEVIERLMCDLSVDPGAIARRHGFATDHFCDLALRLEPALKAGIARLEGGRVSVPVQHRLFLRSVATFFDAHFRAGPGRHAKAV
jgi:oxygen-independent coproporphyrinogen-3 oxidase